MYLTSPFLPCCKTLYSSSFCFTVAAGLHVLVLIDRSCDQSDVLVSLIIDLLTAADVSGSELIFITCINQQRIIQKCIDK